MINFGGVSSRGILFLSVLDLETTEQRNLPRGGGFLFINLDLLHLFLILRISGFSPVRECVVVVGFCSILIFPAFITGKSSLEPLLEGLFAQICVNLSGRVFDRNRTGDLRITKSVESRALHH